MIYRSLEIPRWLKGGIQPNDKGSAARKFIYGGDTETFEGPPITFQFFSEQAGVRETIWIDNPRNASKLFLKWCDSLVSNAHHVVYIHNLTFDLPSLFWDCKEDLIQTSSGEFEFDRHGWSISGVYGAPTFLRMTDSSRKRTVLLVDSFSYYRASLEKAAKVFCPHLPKLVRPDGLGKKRFAKTDQQFIDYGMRDAEVAYYIGVGLEGLHDEFDLTQTVSVADMAARIFRHHYLDRPIPQAPMSVLECGLLSYHGGKNNMPVKRGWYEGVSSLDLSSAYPHAMASFPSFYHADLYTKFKAKRPKQVPDLGVYYVAGRVKHCDWPSMFAHNFDKLGREGDEEIGGIAVCGFELNEALRSGEFKPTDVQGWFYDRDGDADPPPLKAFCDEFYARKEAETDKAKRAMYKFILNSVSGKFIQTRKRDEVTYVDLEDDTVTSACDITAGGMFHPFIASLITGHTRARIHKLEHQWDAVHTATDGIFTQKKVSHAKLGPQKGLGALVNEAQGDLLLLRNKLYILYGDGPGDVMSTVYKDRHVIKSAHHGFAGSLADLERLAATGERKYKVEKANRLRASLKSGATPNQFEQRSYSLAVGDLPMHA
jgi:hypothetical protein